MSQKFFISFNSADREKAHWISWTLKEAGHEVAVHDWELPAGGNAPLWMNRKLAWADRLIAVVSPDYTPAKYSSMEWSATIWDDPDGTKGSVIPIVVRPTPKFPPLLKGLSRIDLTSCTEEEAQQRLLAGIALPAPPPRKPEFLEMEAEPPAPDETGPSDHPNFTVVQVNDGLPRWLKFSAAIATVASAVIAGLVFVFGSGDAPERECTTIAGGTVICGDLVDQRTQSLN